jgi:hypothetical protein
MPTKNKFYFTKLFCKLLFEGTFTSVFKEKQSKRSHRIQIQEAQKYTGPTDPDMNTDPQNWLLMALWHQGHI